MQLMRRRPLLQTRSLDGPRLRGLHRKYGLATQCFGQNRLGPYGAVRGAVRRINHFLQRHEETEDDSVTLFNKAPNVALGVRTEYCARIKETRSIGLSLKDYLQLPVSEYELLDPDWIRPVSDKGEAAFRLTFPIKELLGIETGDVVVDIRVNRCPAQGDVSMTIEGVTFGRPELDRYLDMRLRLLLFISPDRWKWRPFSRRCQPVDTILQNVDDLNQIRSATGMAVLDVKDLTGNKANDGVKVESRDASRFETAEVEPVTEEEGRWTRLKSSLWINLGVSIHPIIDNVPHVVLVSIGQILLRAVMGNVLPKFVNLVAQDYSAWSIGAPRGLPKHSHGLYKTDPKDGKGILFENED